LAACGGSHHDHTTSAPIIPIVTSTEQPASYGLADQGCQGSTATVTLTKGFVRRWDDAAVRTDPVTLTGMTSGTSLTTPAITGTRFAESYERSCDYRKPAEERCLDKEGDEKGWMRNDQAGGWLKLCADGQQYGRTTYEGVAVSSAYYITQAQALYDAVAPKGPKLEAIGLTVLPEFADYYEHFPTSTGEARLKTVITHNLAYFPQGKLIAVFPETQERAASAPGFFWESPFVLGHEYGHHIDAVRHGDELLEAGLAWEPLTHTYVDLMAAQAGLPVTTQRAKLRGALAEGFADLLGYYLDGATGRGVRGLPDIGSSRDVGADEFTNGDAKALDQDRLGLFLSTDADAGEVGGGLSYADIHIVGAIFAHTVDDVFRTLVETQGDASTPAAIQQRYAMALAWMDEVSHAVAKSPNPTSQPEWIAPLNDALTHVVQSRLAQFPLTDPESQTQLRHQVCVAAQAGLPVTAGNAPFAENGVCP
jgi:hypothetical protein